MHSSLRRSLAACTCLAMLASCAAGQVAISKRNLDVQTKVSDSFFLEPVAPSERSILVQVRNSSDKPDLDIEGPIREKLQAQGLRIVEDPDEAQYLLQALILQAGRNTETAAEAAYNEGFGSTIVGGAAGAGVGYGLGEAGGHNALLIIAGALAGAAVATFVDSYVQDVTYTVVADLLVSERAGETEIVSQSDSQSIEQGSSGETSTFSSQNSEWKRYKTRVVSTANQVNLEFPEAAPDLVDGMTRAISGLF